MFRFSSLLSRAFADSRCARKNEGKAHHWSDGGGREGIGSSEKKAVNKASIASPWGARKPDTVFQEAFGGAAYARSAMQREDW